MSGSGILLLVAIFGASQLDQRVLIEFPRLDRDPLHAEDIPNYVQPRKNQPHAFLPCLPGSNHAMEEEHTIATSLEVTVP